MHEAEALRAGRPQLRKVAVAFVLLRTPAARRRGGVAGLAALPLHAALKQACRNAALALQGHLAAPAVGTQCVATRAAVGLELELEVRV